VIGSIGLTGGIGSGKSTVAALLAERGACLVDTDAIARSLTAPGGAALPALAQAFGADILAPDGALDRERMRHLAFGDAASKARLEAVLHPLIATEADARAAAAGGRPVVFDVPLLAESARWRPRVDRILVVDCPEKVQVARVVQRSGWDAATVERVIAQQASRSRRRALADAVIHNGDSTSLPALAAQVARLWAAWFAHAGSAATAIEQTAPGPVEQ
jgi:dephospho-CoA kinase